MFKKSEPKEQEKSNMPVAKKGLIVSYKTSIINPDEPSRVVDAEILRVHTDNTNICDIVTNEGDSSIYKAFCTRGDKTGQWNFKQ